MSTSARVKMKAMVVARLLMGDFSNWRNFEEERDFATRIANRQSARSVSAQIGRGYKELSIKTKNFISENFEDCDYADLANLCDAVVIGYGIHDRIDRFEKNFFQISKDIKEAFPFHAHVSVSLYGLQFEYPEHHFLKDIETAVEQLSEVQPKILNYRVGVWDKKTDRLSLQKIISKEKLMNRVLIIASFNLIESFISGLFYEVVENRSMGKLALSEAFISYAAKNETDILRRRLDKTIRYISNDAKSVETEPFQYIIEKAKFYRDAIHHTTPFSRKGISEGERLLALYRVDCELALAIGSSVLLCITEIQNYLYPMGPKTAIASDCDRIHGQIASLRAVDQDQTSID